MSNMVLNHSSFFTSLTLLICTLFMFACETEPFEPIPKDAPAQDTTTQDTTVTDTSNADSNACDTSDYTFSGFMTPLFVDNGCKSCHQGSSASGGVYLDNYDSVKVVADNGRLLGSISHSNGFSNMPQGGNKLDSCTIAKVELWINAGAQNN